MYYHVYSSYDYKLLFNKERLMMATRCEPGFCWHPAERPTWFSRAGLFVEVEWAHRDRVENEEGAGEAVETE